MTVLESLHMFITQISSLQYVNHTLIRSAIRLYMGRSFSRPHGALISSLQRADFAHPGIPDINNMELENQYQKSSNAHYIS